MKYIICRTFSTISVHKCRNELDIEMKSKPELLPINSNFCGGVKKMNTERLRNQNFIL